MRQWRPTDSLLLAVPGQRLIGSAYVISREQYILCVTLTNQQKAYAAIDGRSIWYGIQFLEEAKLRWQTQIDHPTTVAACMILCLGLTSDGEIGLSTIFTREGIAMAQRLKLLNVQKSADEVAMDESSTTTNEYRVKAHIAWGAFDWICIHSMYYDQSNIYSIERTMDGPLIYPPSYYIPEYV